jgi:hypothetical protein
MSLWATDDTIYHFYTFHCGSKEFKSTNYLKYINSKTGEMSDSKVMDGVVFTNDDVLESQNGVPVFITGYGNYAAHGLYVNDSKWALVKDYYSDSYEKTVTGTKYYYYNTKLIRKYYTGSTTGMTTGNVVIRTPYVAGKSAPYPKYGWTTSYTDTSGNAQAWTLVSYSYSSEDITKNTVPS